MLTLYCFSSLVPSFMRGKKIRMRGKKIRMRGDGNEVREGKYQGSKPTEVIISAKKEVGSFTQ